MKTRLLASAAPDRLETWARDSNGLYPDCRATCRNHPRLGPRPGYCAYQQKIAAR